MNKIRKKVLKKIEKDNVLIGQLMAHFDKSSMTIGRWIKANDVRLTLPSALKIISLNTGLVEEDILDSVEAENKVTTTV